MYILYACVATMQPNIVHEFYEVCLYISVDLTPGKCAQDYRLFIRTGILTQEINYLNVRLIILNVLNKESFINNATLQQLSQYISQLLVQQPYVAETELAIKSSSSERHQVPVPFQPRFIRSVANISFIVLLHISKNLISRHWNCIDFCIIPCFKRKEYSFIFNNHKGGISFS